MLINFPIFILLCDLLSLVLSEQDILQIIGVLFEEVFDTLNICSKCGSLNSRVEGNYKQVGGLCKIIQNCPKFWALEAHMTDNGAYLAAAELKLFYNCGYPLVLVNAFDIRLSFVRINYQKRVFFKQNYLIALSGETDLLKRIVHKLQVGDHHLYNLAPRFVERYIPDRGTVEIADWHFVACL